MAGAVDALLAAQRVEGLFAYDFDFVRSQASGRNNIVRQAGAVYALAEYYGHSRESRLREPLRRALRALGLLSVDVGNGALVSHNDKRSGIRAGATALALLAETYYFRTSGDGRFSAIRRAWLQGLLSLHRPAAGFRRSPDSERESPYYNGEIWLALAYYARTFGPAGLAPVLSEVDRYMTRRYAQAPDIGFFHWGVMAAKLRWQTTGDEQFVGFVRNQAQAYLNDLRPSVNRTANTCYALEGLLPALDLSGDEPELHDAIRARIDRELEKNLEFQIQAGQERLDLGNGVYLVSPRIDEFAGAFLAGRDRPFTRIDYTQHCISALIKASAQGRGANGRAEP